MSYPRESPDSFTIIIGGCNWTVDSKLDFSSVKFHRGAVLDPTTKWILIDRFNWYDGIEKRKISPVELQIQNALTVYNGYDNYAGLGPKDFLLKVIGEDKNDRGSSNPDV